MMVSEIARAGPASPSRTNVAGPGRRRRSNRLTGAERGVSVEPVEFRAGHIFGKLGVRSRKDLIGSFRYTAASQDRKLGS
jgi:hypothetical protein